MSITTPEGKKRPILQPFRATMGSIQMFDCYVDTQYTSNHGHRKSVVNNGTHPGLDLLTKL